MVLAAHSDSGFHNESKGRIWSVPHIFLAENEPVPQWNGPILTIYQVINFFMSSAAKTELGVILITWKELVPICQTLIEMVWPQPPTPIQTDNSTDAGVLNETIISPKTKSTDLRLHWLICRESQQQFRFNRAPGSNNWADYITKHHLQIYHKSNRPLFAGAAHQLQQTLLACC